MNCSISKPISLKQHSPNCLIDLEDDARATFSTLVQQSVKSIYNIELDEKQSNKCIYNQLSRPSKGKGHIVLQCLKLTIELKKNPKQINEIITEIVEYISDAINKNKGVLETFNPFLKCDAAKGRIITYLNASYLGKIIGLILDENNCYLSALPSNSQRVMIEYSQPNTHKAFHIGHLRNVALGDCLLRLYDHCGYKTVAVNYFGDEGTHIAKCLWLLQQKIDEEKLDLDNDIDAKIKNKGEWLGNIYTESNIKSQLQTYTKFPFVNIVIAKILSINKHPNNDKYKIVKVEYKNKKNKQHKQCIVVCDGTHYNVGNLICYIPIGHKYKRQVVKQKNMDGILSEGIIMSATDLDIQLPPITSYKEILRFILLLLVAICLLYLCFLIMVNIKVYTWIIGIVVIAILFFGVGIKDKFGKKKKKKKKKHKKLVDNRIYLVDKFYPNTTIDDNIIEVGKYEKYKDVDNVEQLVKQYHNEQQEILKKLGNEDEKIVNLWKKTKKWSLDEFHKIYKWLDVRFDHEFYESECDIGSKKLVKQYYDKGIFVNKDNNTNAIGIDLTTEKLGFPVVLKSNGCGLYLTKDLYLAQIKFDQFKIDKSLYVIDSAQSVYLKQVFATLKRMGYKQAQNCYHISYGFVGLPGNGKVVRMSGRAGTVILFSELIQRLSDEINKKFLNALREKDDDDDDNEKWTEEELKKVERAISIGVIKYGMLNHDKDKDIAFNIDKWTLSTGNTGPYLMLQYARIASILRKFKYPSDIKKEEIDYSVLQNDIEAQNLLFQISQFQKKVEKICENHAPSALCDYLYGICKLFSQWYGKPKNSIKHCHDHHLKATRYQFAKAIAKTIKVGIELLGITPLERI